MLVLQMHKAKIVGLKQVSSAFGIIFDFEMWMSELKGRTQGDITKMAAEAGLVTFFPKPRELMIDIDEPFAAASVKFAAQIGSGAVMAAFDKAQIHFVDTLYTVSKSGNLHAYVALDVDITDYERLIIQAALRSDPVRDVLSMLRLREGKQEHYHMALFETEDQAKLVRKWRVRQTVMDARVRLRVAYTNASIGRQTEL